MSIEHKAPTEAQMQVAATLAAGLLSGMDLKRYTAPLKMLDTELMSQSVALYHRVLNELVK